MTASAPHPTPFSLFGLPWRRTPDIRLRPCSFGLGVEAVTSCAPSDEQLKKRVQHEVRGPEHGSLTQFVMSSAGTLSRTPGFWPPEHGGGRTHQNESERCLRSERDSNSAEQGEGDSAGKHLPRPSPVGVGHDWRAHLPTALAPVPPELEVQAYRVPDDVDQNAEHLVHAPILAPFVSGGPDGAEQCENAAGRHLARRANLCASNSEQSTTQARHHRPNRTNCDRDEREQALAITGGARRAVLIDRLDESEGSNGRQQKRAAKYGHNQPDNPQGRDLARRHARTVAAGGLA